MAYLRDSLSNTERRTLEKKMGEDPFLSDAMDGFEKLPADRIENDLNELEKRLEIRIHKPKTRRLLPILRIVASILLLVSIGGSVYFLYTKEFSTDELAEQVKDASSAPKEKPALPVKEKIPGKAESDLQNKDSLESKANDFEKEKPILALKKESSTSSREWDVSDSTAMSERLIVANEKKDAVIEEEYGKVTKVAVFEEDLSGAVIMEVQASETLFDGLVSIKGRIVDNYGNSIAGATVIIKGTTTGTTTDLDGNFALKAMPEDIITVAFIGMITEELKVSSINHNSEIALTEDLQELEEIVVIGYGTRRKLDLTRSTSSTQEDVLDSSPMPEKGYEKFYKYILNNKTIDSGITVELEFVVNLDGSLSDIEVINTPSATYSEEAMRLLKEGPKWIPAKVGGKLDIQEVNLKIVL